MLDMIVTQCGNKHIEREREMLSYGRLAAIVVMSAMPWPSGRVVVVWPSGLLSWYGRLVVWLLLMSSYCGMSATA